jgi:hypothetical protein
MNATGLSKTLIESNLSSRPLPPASRFGKLTAALRETIVVLEASLFWTLVLLIASLLWLGSGLLKSLSNMFHPRSPTNSSCAACRDPVGAEVSVTLVLVLAVITAGVGALAYEWCHAQAVKRAQSSLVARNHK